MRSRAAVAVIAVVLLSACVWRRNEEVASSEAGSHLRFVGATAGAVVAVAGKRSYSFTLDDDRGDADEVRYAIAPDSYRVTVVKDGQVVVDRKIFVAGGETREVRIP